jgi:hypothetical protein
MNRGVHLATLPLLFFLAFSGVNQKRLTKLEAKFKEQKGAVHQAKVLAKLLPAEVQMASEEIQQGEIDQGMARLERWSNRTQQVHDALIATGHNPVKRPAGFTELQVALRESLRGLRDIIFSMPLGRRHPAETVRSNLSQINSQLLQELFPPPPLPKKGAKK